LTIFLDRALTYRVIDSVSVINWVFLPNNPQINFYRSFPWSIIQIALEKIKMRASLIQKELENARFILQSIPENERDEKMSEVIKVREFEEASEKSRKEERNTYLTLNSKLTNYPNKTEHWKKMHHKISKISRSYI